MRIKLLSLVILFTAIAMSGCAPKRITVKGGPIENIAQLKSTDQLLVGSVEIIPEIKESERDFSRISNKPFIDAHKKIFWVVRGDKWLDTKKYDIYASSGGMSMDFSNHTPVALDSTHFYIPAPKGTATRISGGYLPTQTQKVTHTTSVMNSGGLQNRYQQSEYTPVATHMPFRLTTKADDTSTAIYIGDIKIYRDKSMKVTKVVVKDNYTQANSAYKAKFKVKGDLKKSLATR